MFGPLCKRTDQWSVDLRNLKNPYPEKWIIGVMVTSSTFTFEKSSTQAINRLDFVQL